MQIIALSRCSIKTHKVTKTFHLVVNNEISPAMTKKACEFIISNIENKNEQSRTTAVATRNKPDVGVEDQIRQYKTRKDYTIASVCVFMREPTATELREERIKHEEFISIKNRAKKASLKLDRKAYQHTKEAEQHGRNAEQHRKNAEEYQKNVDYLRDIHKQYFDGSCRSIGDSERSEQSSTSQQQYYKTIDVEASTDND